MAVTQGTIRQSLSRTARAALVCSLPMLTACDDELLMPPTPVDARFARYVAIGNSITAGFQSGGINDSTQLQSYVVLLAQQLGLEVGVEFNVPLLNPPGCPAPFTNIFTQERVGGTGGADCALRQRRIPTVIHNLAFPGSDVLEVLTNDAPPVPSATDVFKTFLLGGRTQIEAAREVQPTFASVWIGNNDVLGAALAGDAGLATSVPAFTSSFNALVDSLVDMGIQGAVLIGVGNVNSIPHLSPGVAYWLAPAGAFGPFFSVNANCGPAALGGVGESTLVPFGYGFGVLIAQASVGIPSELDCVNDAPVLTAAELTTIGGAIIGYNKVIEDAAAAQGWAYFDPNPVFDSLATAGEIPLFPNATGADAVTRPFGDIFSRDGVHPSALAHKLVVDHVIDAINATYGTTIPRP